MPAPTISDDLKAEIARRAYLGQTNNKIGRELKLHRATVEKYRPADAPATGDCVGDRPGRAPDPTPPPPDRFVEDGDSATLEKTLPGIVRTEADALRLSQVDLTVWRVKRCEIVHWSNPLNVKQGQEVVDLTKTGFNGKTRTVQALRQLPSKSEQQQQTRVKLVLERLLPKPQRDALDLLWERMKAHAPKYPKLPAPRIKGESHLAVFCLFDSHFGKLCWGPETGSNYDLKIAETVYQRAIEDLLHEVAHQPVGRICLPIGNDFFQMDNRNNTTLAGTVQDVDGRYAKVIEAGEMAVVKAVELLMTVAPVDVLWVPGNHDATTSYHLARTLGAWFRNTDRVTVDYTPTPRKYLRYGSTLLGFTHGDQEKKEDLPNLMAVEQPADWAIATVCREWLCGHDHRERKYATKPVDTYQGTTVRVCRSLAGTDAWHHKRGYVGQSQAAEVFLYSATRGYVGHDIVSARP